MFYKETNFYKNMNESKVNEKIEHECVNFYGRGGRTFRHLSTRFNTVNSVLNLVDKIPLFRKKPVDFKTSSRLMSNIVQFQTQCFFLPLTEFFFSLRSLSVGDRSLCHTTSINLLRDLGP